MERALYAAVDRLDRQALPIPYNTILELIQRCSKAKDLVASEKLHFILTKDKLDVITILGNHLIRMFTSCGSLNHADTAFYKVTNPDAYTWNALISAHATLGQFDHAFNLYNSMHKTSIRPNTITFLCIIKACTCNKALQKGRFVHDHVIKTGLMGVLAVENTLIDMYGKCGSLEEAERVFDGLTNRDVVTWTVMANGYVQHELGMRALELFEKMCQRAVQPSRVVFLLVLKACLIITSLVHGRKIHDGIVQSSFDSDVKVGSVLIELYAKCGSLQEAHGVFDRLPNRDVVVWCSLLAGYAEKGYNLQVLELYEDMQKAAVEPDRVTYIYLLKACGGMGALVHGLMIHHILVTGSLESDSAISNSLIDMFGKCGDFKGAFAVFNMLSYPDEVSWGAIITMYVHHGHDDLALQLYDDMLKRHAMPDKPIFFLVSRACGNIGNFEQGSLIHKAFIERGLESDVMVSKTLIDMYGKCTSLEEATYVFDHTLNKNLDLWDALIAAYSSHDEHSCKALELFEKFQQQGYRPTKGIFLCILKVCGGLRAVEEGKRLHDELIRTELELDGLIENTVIDMYSKCGLLQEACCVFKRLAKPSEVSWGAMIAGYVGHGKSFAALKLFQKMQVTDIGANVTVSTCILKACGDVGASMQGRILHDKVIKSGLVTDDALNTLVYMYANCGNMDEAQKMFDSALSKNFTSWSALISGYTQQGSGLKALDLYKKMHQANCKQNKAVALCMLQACSITGAFVEGRLVFMQVVEDGFELDALLGNTLLDMYSKCGSMLEASHVFAMLPKRDMVSWGVLMAGFVRNNECGQVKACFKQMEQEGLRPEDFIFTSILAACSHAGFLKEGLRFFTMMIVDYGISPRRDHYSCISDLLGRAGCFHDALDVLLSMPMAPDIILWTALLDSCENHGNKRFGSQCFEELLHADPNDASWYVLMLRIWASASDSCVEV
ncbi:hypothetical protein GOP47_0006661 [Adiantum capillus-veneris]|uniref:Pentatricopeptide repeat-containing protein n=1 Tax=Adiantum capillus-veneris TaxID=13818 RepID=A0A9D4V3A8_ADICA|nr:hypothetical protein GOP47_0006661 [Adiantum capillus-veneris]